MIRAAGVDGVDWRPAVDELRRDGQRILDEALTMANKAGVVARAVLSDRAPIDGILEAVKDSSADLVVMGTHGRKGFSRMVLGSTTEGIYGTHVCPFLFLRPRIISAVTAQRYQREITIFLRV